MQARHDDIVDEFHAIISKLHKRVSLLLKLDWRIEQAAQRKNSHQLTSLELRSNWERPPSALQTTQPGLSRYWHLNNSDPQRDRRAPRQFC